MPKCDFNKVALQFGKANLASQFGMGVRSPVNLLHVFRTFVFLFIFQNMPYYFWVITSMKNVNNFQIAKLEGVAC